MKACVLILTFVAAMTFLAASFAGQRTTLPSKRVTILVQITDNGLKLTKFAQMSDAANPELVVMRGPVPRGNYLSINVINSGKKTHNFVFLGKRTKWIKPGRTAHLFVTALTRGRFPYRSTLDTGPEFRGYVTVY